MSNKPIAVLDFGTSKVLVLVGESSENGIEDKNVTVTNVGVAEYDGFMDSTWNTPESVTDAIASAIEAAEKKNNTHIKEIYVGVPGEFIRVYVIESSVALQGADPTVTPADVEKVMRQATEMLQNPSGVIIHRSPAWFKVDGGSKILEPVTVKGATLEGMIGFIIADQFFINDVTARLKQLGITVKGFYSTSIAEALQCIVADDRDKTAVLIDVGYLSTEVMVVEGDAIVWQEVLPMGGVDITLDLVEGIKKPFDVCERIKRGYVFNGPKNAQIEIQGDDGHMETVSGDTVSEVVEARVDELLEACEDAINRSGVRLGNWSNVYFTGGGLMLMKGARVYAAGKLKKYTVREATPKLLKMKQPHIYASGGGLLELVANTVDQQERNLSFLDRLRRLFRK